MQELYGKQTKITRPDLRQPDLYNIQLDESMLMWIEESLVEKVMHIYDSIGAHHECDLRIETGCRVRDRWLISQHGTLDEAFKVGFKQTDCTEDLAYLHSEMGRIMNTLFQARYLRTTVNAHSYYTEEHATQELARIQAEVRYRETQAEQQTGELSRLTDDAMATIERTKDDKEKVFQAPPGPDDKTAGPTKSAAATKTEAAVEAVKQVADKNRTTTPTKKTS